MRRGVWGAGALPGAPPKMRGLHLVYALLRCKILRGMELLSCWPPDATGTKMMGVEVTIGGP